MQTSTKIKIGILSTTLLIAVGTAVYQVNTWSNSYDKMEQKQIQNFETLWDEVWDEKTKTFTSKLTPDKVQKLETLAGTPAQQELLDLAKTSVSLITVKHHNATLSQYVAAANYYYQSEKADNNFPDQQKLNSSIITEIETLITDINTNINNLNITNNTIDFDKTISSVIVLNQISTNLKWTDLTTFNNHISKINTLIQTQVQENNDKLKQEEIINLKAKLDEFVLLTKEYESNIKSDYITIKDLKAILNQLSNIDVSKHQDWFVNLQSYDGTITQTSYFTSFTNQFFIDNKDLEPYKEQLSQISILVELKRNTSNVSKKSDEKKEQVFQYSLNTSTSQSESDLVNINSLENIAIKIIQTQTVKTYVEETQSSSTTSSSSSGQTSNSTTTDSSTTPIPIRRQD